MLRVWLPLSLLLPLLGAIGITARYWAWLDARYLAGPTVVGLCVSAVAILGTEAQLAADSPDDREPSVVMGRFARYTIQMIAFLLAFTAGIVDLVIAVNRLRSSILLAPQSPRRIMQPERQDVFLMCIRVQHETCSAVKRSAHEKRVRNSCSIGG